jgi:hypothetical protein
MRVRFAALLAVLLVIGIAGAASGSTGDPLLLGKANHERRRPTTFTFGGDTYPALSILAGRAPGLTVTSDSSDAWGVKGVARGIHDTIGVEGDGLGQDFSVGVGAVATPGNLALSTTGASSFGGSNHFLTSGTATVPAGSAYVTVQVRQWSNIQASMDESSYALATLQGYVPHTFVLAAVPDVATQTVTIHLNRPAPKAVTVAWFVADPS